jgi:SAM-dependent methyltransferase
MAEDRQRMRDVFHRWNATLNDLFFGPKAGYQKYYRALVDQRSGRASVVVDLGCGTVDVRKWLHVPDGTLLVACDYSPGSLARNENPVRVACDATLLPFANESIELLISDNLIEHLAEPERFFDDCLRVLKPGGSLIFATPNKYSYVSIIASLTPTRVHRLFKRVQQAHADSMTDTCETLYRANTTRAVARLAAGTGFEISRLDAYVGAPCYSLWFPPPLHLVFISLHRMIEFSRALQKAAGLSIVAELRKPAVAAAAKQTLQGIVSVGHDEPCRISG